MKEKDPVSGSDQTSTCMTHLKYTDSVSRLAPSVLNGQIILHFNWYSKQINTPIRMIEAHRSYLL